LNLRIEELEEVNKELQSKISKIDVSADLDEEVKLLQ
jgi:hypothetical protein